MRTFDELVNLDILLEEINSDPFSLESLSQVLAKERYHKTIQSNLEFIIDKYYLDYAQDYLNLCRNVFNTVQAWIKKNNIPYYDERGLISQFFAFEEFKLDEASFWPVTIYVAANPDEYKDYATTGLLLYQNGKVEVFEGNDEATPETIQLVNRLIGAQSIVKQVWSNQPQNVIEQIQNDRAPAGIYVSPLKSHAEAYWAEGRTLCTFKISMDHISQESDIDWKVITNAQIKNVRIF